jgi:hypothetical protein
MRNDWALAMIAYPLSRYVFPALTLGRVRVAAWDTRADAPWCVKRTGRTRLELGPDLAGLLVCGVLAMEAFSLMSVLPLLNAIAPE